MQTHSHKKSYSRGFTLIELSIVITIIALLLGGVFAGRSMIKAAELRSVITQYKTFKTGVDSFVEKYAAGPGDMPNAANFWGLAAAGAACATTSSASSQLTCNGDGDGVINPSSATSNELFRFWQQLANAGFIEGSYSGVTDGSTIYSTTSKNAPTTKKSQGQWFVINWGTAAGDAYNFAGIYNNTFQLGAVQANWAPSTGLFLPEELWNIDSKMDDGMPGTGKLIANAPSGLSNCTSTSTGTNTNTTYLVSSTTTACLAAFPKIF